VLVRLAYSLPVRPYGSAVGGGRAALLTA
jgi:hypothetical protein